MPARMLSVGRVTEPRRTTGSPQPRRYPKPGGHKSGSSSTQQQVQCRHPAQAALRGGCISRAEQGASPHLMVATVVHVAGQWEPWRQRQLPCQHFWPNELLQVRSAEPPVPVICDVASVHDLPEQVAQVVIGHLRAGAQRDAA